MAASLLWDPVYLSDCTYLWVLITVYVQNGLLNFLSFVTRTIQKCINVQKFVIPPDPVSGGKHGCTLFENYLYTWSVGIANHLNLIKWKQLECYQYLVCCNVSLDTTVPRILHFEKFAVRWCISGILFPGSQTFKAIMQYAFIGT